MLPAIDSFGNFRTLEWENNDLNILLIERDLRFVDDIVLLALYLTLQCMLNTLQEASQKIGLQMDIAKTKAMTNRELGSSWSDNVL